MKKKKVRIQGWFSGEQTEAKIGDLWKWIENHDGVVMVFPPSATSNNEWIIATTDKTNRFNQR